MSPLDFLSAGLPQSAASLSYPLRSSAALISASAGGSSSNFVGPNPHRLTSGPTVMSKAPSVIWLISSAPSTTWQSAADTGRQSVDASALNTDNSDSGR